MKTPNIQTLRPPRWLALGCALVALSALAGPAAQAAPAPAAVTHIYGYCRAQADAAFRRERGVDQDILATRGNDWQRAGTLGSERDDMFAEAAGHAGAVLSGCRHSAGAGPG